MSTFGEGSQVGEESAAPAAGVEHQRHSMDQLSKIAGKTEVLLRT